ncbi:MAG: DUF190 domain-containing protein [Actinomycetota bacterium]|nr:DUF190 domain-containing protein [Actinomycetota bacterium]
MAETELATRLVVFLTEDDRTGHRSLYETLLKLAREQGLAGATVWRGVEGFGSAGIVRTSRFPDAASGLPIMLEIIDLPEKVDRFLDELGRIAPGAFATRESVRVSRFSRQS